MSEQELEDAITAFLLDNSISELLDVVSWCIRQKEAQARKEKNVTRN